MRKNTITYYSITFSALYLDAILFLNTMCVMRHVIPRCREKRSSKENMSPDQVVRAQPFLLDNQADQVVINLFGNRRFGKLISLFCKCADTKHHV